jgi:hypothetical protein
MDTSAVAPPPSETAALPRSNYLVEELIDFEARTTPDGTSLKNFAGSFEDRRWDGYEATPVAQPPPASRPDARQLLIQTFLGEVIELSDTEFVAVLKDQTDRTRPDERVTFAVDEVVDEDRSLLTPGSMFYWFIFDESRYGSKRTVTDLRFRRLPKWTKQQLAVVHQRAAERARLFGIAGS